MLQCSHEYHSKKNLLTSYTSRYSTEIRRYLNTCFGIRYRKRLFFKIFIDTDAVATYTVLVDHLVDASNQTYRMIENGNFTVYAGNNVYPVEGNILDAVVICPSDGMVYDGFYCSKYALNKVYRKSILNSSPCLVTGTDVYKVTQK